MEENLHHLRLGVVESLLPPGPISGSGNVQQATRTNLPVDIVHGQLVFCPVQLKKVCVIREEDIVVCSNHRPHVVSVRSFLAQGWT